MTSGMREGPRSGGSSAIDARRRGYDGYGSYQYLRAGRDYTRYKLSSELSRVPESWVVLDETQEARVEELATKCLIISLHDHASVRPEKPADFGPYREQGREFTPYRGLAASPLDVVFDGGMATVSKAWHLRAWAWEDIVADLGMRQSDWAHQAMVTVIRSTQDILACKASRRIGLVLTLEAADPIGDELDRLDVLYGLGVRSIGVSYNKGNVLGSGLADAEDSGLTHFGRAAVRRMNQLGILIDLSHAGDRTSLDTISASKAPVVISHAGARAVWPTARMKPDEVIKACAAAGGIIGIEAAPASTLADDPTRHDIESVFRHFTHCLELVGTDHVSFGPDTHYGDHAAWSRMFFGHAAKASPLDDLTVPWVIGGENPTEIWWNIMRLLVREGFSDLEIAKFVGGNIMRVLGDSW